MSEEPREYQLELPLIPPHTPLSVGELQALRDMIEADRNRKWFWRKVKIISYWIASGLTGLIALKQAIKDFISGA